MNLLVLVETTSHHEYHWMEESEKRIDPAAVDFSPASPKGARAMSEEMMDSNQRTVEDPNMSGLDPLARNPEWMYVTMVLCIVALAIATYVKLEEADAILSVGTR